MVKIVDYKSIIKDNGDEFFALTLKGGLEAVKSRVTGKTYFTVRTVNVPCTFNEETCKTVIGTEIEGSIIKIPCESYSYVIQDTGEEIELNYRFEFVDSSTQILESNVVDKSLVY